MAEYLTVDEVAARLRVEKETLHRWRREKIGPPYIQVKKGATVIYPLDALSRWEAQQVGAST